MVLSRSGVEMMMRNSAGSTRRGEIAGLRPSSRAWTKITDIMLKKGALPVGKYEKASEQQTADTRAYILKGLQVGYGHCHSQQPQEPTSLGLRRGTRTACPGPSVCQWGAAPSSTWPATWANLTPNPWDLPPHASWNISS